MARRPQTPVRPPADLAEWLRALRRLANACRGIGTGRKRWDTAAPDGEYILALIDAVPFLEEMSRCPWLIDQPRGRRVAALVRRLLETLRPDIPTERKGVLRSYAHNDNFRLSERLALAINREATRERHGLGLEADADEDRQPLTPAEYDKLSTELAKLSRWAEVSLRIWQADSPDDGTRPPPLSRTPAASEAVYRQILTHKVAGSGYSTLKDKIQADMILTAALDAAKLTLSERLVRRAVAWRDRRSRKQNDGA